MEQSTSWESNRFSASQATPRILWNPEAHYLTHKCPTPVPVLSQIDPAHAHTSHLLKIHLLLYQSISPGSRHVFMSRNKASFYGEELSAPRPTSKLEDHPLSAVRDFLFNIFAATLHIGGHFFIRNLRMRHAWRQGPTYHEIFFRLYVCIHTHTHTHRVTFETQVRVWQERSCLLIAYA